MNSTRRVLLKLLAAMPVLGTGMFNIEAAEAAESVDPIAAAANVMSVEERRRRFCNAYNYWYYERHQKIYPDMAIYMPKNYEQLMELSDAAKPTDETNGVMENSLEGDVFFAAMICHFAKNEGQPEFQSVTLETQRELSENYTKFEEIWRSRNDEPLPLYLRARAPWCPRLEEDIETEVAYLRDLKERNPHWTGIIERIMARNQDELSWRTAFVAHRG